MPSSRSKRARTRRAAGGRPRAVASERRAVRARQSAEESDRGRRAARSLGTEGERPPGPFGGVPVSEIAILAGIVAAVSGFFSRSGLVLVAGLAVCALGVIEVTGREHFSGYRSHSALLAAIPAVAIEAGVAFGFGDPSDRAFLLLIIVPVFGVLFWALRGRFQLARQARVARAARGVAPPISRV